MIEFMRLIQILKASCLGLVLVVMSSCAVSKENYLESWDTLASETALNHSHYTDSDWEKVNKTFSSLQKKESHYSLSVAEKTKITKAKATIVMYETKDTGTSVLGDVKDLIESGAEIIGDIFHDILGK